jgi:hypothetical protein
VIIPHPSPTPPGLYSSRPRQEAGSFFVDDRLQLEDEIEQESARKHIPHAAMAADTPNQIFGRA